jgi:thiaminase/transcriptional activator TenA
MDLFDRLKAGAAEDWRAYIDHAFVRGMGDGSLPEAAFRHYLVQDYLFLIHFARAYALAVYKSGSLDEMRGAFAGLKAILDTEMDLHVRLCGRWGLTPDDLERAPESRATLAYTRFVLESGLRGDLLDLHVALAPCVVGYAEIGRALAEKPGALARSNPYREWIGEYSGEPYQDVAAGARRHLDRLAALSLTEERLPRLRTIFAQATRLEADFWQMGLTLAD